MYTPNWLPAPSPPEHRVRESLPTRVTKLLCAIFLGLILFLGMITFILWLSLRPHRPRFYIHEFTVPGLFKPGIPLTFNATAQNPNHVIGIFYDSMDGAVYYKNQRIESVKSLLQPFYQEPQNSTVINGSFSGPTLTVSKKRWMALLNDRAKGTVVFHFRLELTSRIRFKISAWDTKRHRMYANCDLDVGHDGLILPSSKHRRCPVYFT